MGDVGVGAVVVVVDPVGLVEDKGPEGEGGKKLPSLVGSSVGHPGGGSQ